MAPHKSNVADVDCDFGTVDSSDKSSSSPRAAVVILHVPKSTRREMNSNDVRKASMQMPGFRDWRNVSDATAFAVDGHRDGGGTTGTAMTTSEDDSRRRGGNDQDPPVGVDPSGHDVLTAGGYARRTYEQVKSSRGRRSDVVVDGYDSDDERWADDDDNGGGIRTHDESCGEMTAKCDNTMGGKGRNSRRTNIASMANSDDDTTKTTRVNANGNGYYGNAHANAASTEMREGYKAAYANALLDDTTSYPLPPRHHRDVSHRRSSVDVEEVEEEEMSAPRASSFVVDDDAARLRRSSLLFRYVDNLIGDINDDIETRTSKGIRTKKKERRPSSHSRTASKNERQTSRRGPSSSSTTSKERNERQTSRRGALSSSTTSKEHDGDYVVEHSTRMMQGGGGSLDKSDRQQRRRSSSSDRRHHHRGSSPRRQRDYSLSSASTRDHHDEGHLDSSDADRLRRRRQQRRRSSSSSKEKDGTSHHRHRDSTRKPSGCSSSSSASKHNHHNEGHLDSSEADRSRRSQQRRRSSSYGEENHGRNHRHRSSSRRPSGCSTSSATRGSSSHILFDDGASIDSSHWVRPSDTTKPSSRIADSEEGRRRRHHRYRRRSSSPENAGSRPRKGRSISGGSRRSSILFDVEDQASVGSIRSSVSTRSHVSNRSNCSSDGSRGQRGSKCRSIVSRSAPFSTDGKKDDDDNVTTESAGTGTKFPRKGFFRHMKQLACKVKNTLGELGGLNGVHKFQLGEVARYKTAKIRDKQWMIAEGKYDVMTMTAEVEVVALHVDAVLEIPYYTIQLADGSRKRTNWDNLMTLSDYKKFKSASATVNEIGVKDHDSCRRNTSRIRSILSFSSQSRGGRTRSPSSSSRFGNELEAERGRSSSRHSRTSESREGDDDYDSASNSSRQRSRSKSNHGSKSTQDDGGCGGDGGDNTEARSSGIGSRIRRGRPRSQSPFSRRHEVDELDNRRDHRPSTTKNHQELTRSHPRTRSGRSPAPKAGRESVCDGTACHEEKLTRSSRGRTKVNHQGSVRSVSSVERNIVKKGRDSDRERDDGESDSNQFHGSRPRSFSCISSECSEVLVTAKIPLPCTQGIVVEDVNEDSDDDDCW